MRGGFRDGVHTCEVNDEEPVTGEDTAKRRTYLSPRSQPVYDEPAERDIDEGGSFLRQHPPKASGRRTAGNTAGSIAIVWSTDVPPAALTFSHELAR